MSTFDGLLIFGGVGLIIILPIIAIAVVYYLGRQNQQKFQRIIEMDGARCIQAKDGSVTINTKVWLNVIALIFLVAALGVCGFVAITNMNQGPLMAIEQVVLVGIWAICTVPAVIYLWRALRRPAFYFSPERQTLEIRRGRSRRQIPFGQTANLSVEAWQKDVGWLNQGFYQQASIPCAGIKLGLANGEAIELGTLSSIKSQEDLRERCRNICQLVAGVTGASLPAELLLANS